MSSRSALSLPALDCRRFLLPKQGEPGDGGGVASFTQAGPSRYRVSTAARSLRLADPRFPFRQTPRQDERDRSRGSRREKPAERIRGRDVVAALETRGVKAQLAAPASAGFEPLSPARRQIAEAVTLSRRTIPSFVIDRWVETTAIDKARMALEREIETSIGLKPTFTDFLLQALASSLFRPASPHPRSMARSGRRCGQDWRDELRCRARRRRR
jgi:pyruvate/2-oxoglutarate dehydrogenase complex dihydrolipoamide acyltransferase (E2) component